MAGVEAYSYAAFVVDFVYDVAYLFESVTDVAALSGGVLYYCCNK